MSSVHDCRIIDLPRIPDARGNLTFVEGSRHVPFAIQRVYSIYNVPGGETRGGHAYHQLQELVIALSGSFDMVVHDGREERRLLLNRAYSGLYLPKLIWRHVDNFSTNAVCLVLASGHYDESDYIRNFEAFVKLRTGGES